MLMNKHKIIKIYRTKVIKTSTYQQLSAVYKVVTALLQSSSNRVAVIMAGVPSSLVCDTVMQFYQVGCTVINML